jgi:hypothetical protein
VREDQEAESNFTERLLGERKYLNGSRCLNRVRPVSLENFSSNAGLVYLIEMLLMQFCSAHLSCSCARRGFAQ